jgi:hypothetical protein
MGDRFHCILKIPSVYIVTGDIFLLDWRVSRLTKYDEPVLYFHMLSEHRFRKTADGDGTPDHGSSKRTFGTAPRARRYGNRDSIKHCTRLEELASCYREEIDINKYDVLWIWKLPLFEARKS